MSGFRIPGRVDSSGTRACGLMMSCYRDTASATGSVNVNVLPTSGTLRTRMSPPMPQARLLPMASPNPVPAPELVMAAQFGLKVPAHDSNTTHRFPVYGTR
jgi:hypothetical protein